MIETATPLDNVTGASVMGATLVETNPAPPIRYIVECRDRDGNLKWTEEFGNLVTTAGKTDIVDKYLKGAAYTAAWFCGLKGSGAPAVTDTMASHAGWSEVTAYANATLPAIVWGTTAAGSNTATALVFTMNAAYTVAGAFVTTNATKGATTGTLYSAGNFTTARSGDTGDTLTVTLTQTMA